MRLKKEKCQFSLPKIEYLGHVISSEGLELASSKVTVIVDAPAPQDVSELKSLLGLMNYYGKFLPNLATTLLRQGVMWKWEFEQEVALAKVKNALQSPNLLILLNHYCLHVMHPLLVWVLFYHTDLTMEQKPISYASRRLAPAERKYSQLDKEAIAIILGMKHYHQYLYGCKLTILSDHKPLMYILI